jgi:hypothetical protein
VVDVTTLAQILMSISSYPTCCQLMLEVLEEGPCIRGAYIFQNSRSCIKNLGPRRKFCAEDPQILGATTQNSVTRATWHPGFVHPCHTLLFFFALIFL